MEVGCPQSIIQHIHTREGGEPELTAFENDIAIRGVIKKVLLRAVWFENTEVGIFIRDLIHVRNAPRFAREVLFLLWGELVGFHAKDAVRGAQGLVRRAGRVGKV